MRTRYLTYTAHAKILQLLKNSSAVAVNLTCAGECLGLDFVFEPREVELVELSRVPRVCTDLQTLVKLKNGCVDFSYSAVGGEFIISRL